MVKVCYKTMCLTTFTVEKSVDVFFIHHEAILHENFQNYRAPLRLKGTVMKII